MPDEVSPEQRREIKERMKDFKDHELLRIVALEESEFIPEAIQIAREELELRNVKPLDAGEYYIQFPSENPFIDFCTSCLEQTTPEGPEYLGRMGPFSYDLKGFDHECETCGSVLADKWLYFLLFPVRKMEQYRVLLDSGTSQSPQVCRRVKRSDNQPGPGGDGQ